MQAGSAWKVELRKGHRTVNNIGRPLHILKEHPAALTACVLEAQAESMTIEPGEVSPTKGTSTCKVAYFQHATSRRILRHSTLGCCYGVIQAMLHAMLLLTA